MAGVYANFANVSHSDYEFTLTFARVDHEVEDEEIPGVVVSRVNLSPRFMRELIDAMEDNYSKWRTREGIKNLPEYGGRRRRARASGRRVGLRERPAGPGTPGRWSNVRNLPAIGKTEHVPDVLRALRLSGCRPRSPSRSRCARASSGAST